MTGKLKYSDYVTVDIIVWPMNCVLLKNVKFKWFKIQRFFDTKYVHLKIV